MALSMKIFDYQDFEPSNICNVGVAVIGAAAIGAATTAYTSSQASRAQVSAANKAADVQKYSTDRAIELAQGQYGQTREDLRPFRNAGVTAQTELQERLPFLTSGIQVDLPDNMPEMSQEWLEKTPGYQFAKTQGLKAVQNSAAARGLGVSGAALKGAATFATGLADQTYGQQFERGLQTFDRQMARAKTQFDMENTNRGNAYARLMGLVGTGVTAAGATSTAGTAAANTSANASVAGGKGQADAFIGAGNAEAAGIVGMGNAVSRATDNIGGYLTYRGLYGTNPAPVVDGRTPDAYAYGRA